MALLQKETCNLRHPMGLRHPVLNVPCKITAIPTFENVHLLTAQYAPSNWWEFSTVILVATLHSQFCDELNFENLFMYVYL